jgi:hypothetical protein
MIEDAVFHILNYSFNDIVNTHYIYIYSYINKVDEVGHRIIF